MVDKDMMVKKAILFAERLKPFIDNPELFDSLHTDLGDMAEVCSWYINFIDQACTSDLNKEQFDKTLVNLDVNLVHHGTFHLSSIKDAIASITGT